VVDDLAEVVAALDLVADLAENFADLVFDGVRAAGALLEAVQVGAELEVDEVPEIVAGERLVVVDLAALGLRCRPFRPAVGGIEDVGVFFPLQFGLGGFVGFEGIEVFQEEERRSTRHLKVRHAAWERRHMRLESCLPGDHKCRA
jgi:hypothetical protein